MPCFSEIANASASSVRRACEARGRRPSSSRCKERWSARREASSRRGCMTTPLRFELSPADCSLRYRATVAADAPAESVPAGVRSARTARSERADSISSENLLRSSAMAFSFPGLFQARLRRGRWLRHRCVGITRASRAASMVAGIVGERSRVVEVCAGVLLEREMLWSDEVRYAVASIRLAITSIRRDCRFRLQIGEGHLLAFDGAGLGVSRRPA